MKRVTLVLMLACAVSGVVADASLTFDVNKTYQTIEGFGGFGGN